MECVPKTTWNGDMTSIKIVVKEFHQGMSNMYTYGVKLKEKTTHTLYNNGTIYVVRDGARVVFNGRQVCISVKKVAILDQSGSNETKLEQCEHKCFGIGETAVQMTRIEEGGTLIKKKIRGLCCVWSSETWLEISIQKPSYKCLSCQGEECKSNSTKLTECTPGVGCFSMVFKMKLANHTTIYPMKGCTNNRILRYRRSCWNGCRKMAVNYEMCIECCFGDSCNGVKKENSTEISTNLPIKMRRNGASDRSHNSSTSQLLLLTVIIWLMNMSMS
jgi:hypothetical protein